MSTPIDSDLILVEANSTTDGRVVGQIYKETKANFDTATGGGTEPDAEYGVALQFAFSQIGNWSQSGSHFTSGDGALFSSRSDNAGAYTLSSSATATSNGDRPNTQLKIDNSWYTIIEGSSSDYTQVTEPGPFSVYFERSAVSWTLTASEIQTASNAKSGSITGLRIKMDDAPDYSMPNHYIGLKLVSSATTTSNFSGTTGGSYTQVAYANPRDWTGATEQAYQEITWSTGINWT